MHSTSPSFQREFGTGGRTEFVTGSGMAELENGSRKNSERHRNHERWAAESFVQQKRRLDLLHQSSSQRFLRLIASSCSSFRRLWLHSKLALPRREQRRKLLRRSLARDPKTMRCWRRGGIKPQRILPRVSVRSSESGSIY